MKELSKYIELMPNSKLPQSSFLSSNDLSQFVHGIEIHLNTKDLEFYDKVGVFKPALRLKKPKMTGKTEHSLLE